MKILLTDIETSPNLADVWGLWDQNVSLAQLRKATRIIGFGAKFIGDRSVSFHSEYNFGTGKMTGQRAMIKKAWELYDAADAVVTFNGDRFDHLHFQREWIQAGMTPPSPVKSIDLYKVVRKNFKFPSNKLQYVASTLLDDSKVSHSGHQLWVDCLEGSEAVKRKAWNTMRKYCKRDVALLEPLLDKLKPWLGNVLNPGLVDGTGDCCNKCGGTDLERRGFACTATSKFQQYRCNGCGGWSRGGKRIDSVDLRASL